MATHESTVNFENLIRDLADMYPIDVSSVVIVELVANSLDSHATRIAIDFNPQTRVLVVTDNGGGMTASDFEQYHDFAAGLKTRGTGIGFAGVGAKISFNVAKRVLTETRSKDFVGGSDWYFGSGNKLLWEDIQPTHIQDVGTRVQVMFRPDVSLPYSSTEDILLLIRQNYLPLFDGRFLALYAQLGYYSERLTFTVNGKEVGHSNIASDLSLRQVREFFPQGAGKRFGFGVFGLAPREYPLGERACGVLLCTHGKVIKADMFNQFPGDIGPRIVGVVEIPDFIQFLTSSKTDFIRRSKHREFERLYDPVRREFKEWLGDLGVQLAEVSASDEARKLERELRKLIEDVPELGDFFGFRSPKNVLLPSVGGPVNTDNQEGIQGTFPDGEGEGGGGVGGPTDVGGEPGTTQVESDSGTVPAMPISRTTRRGPKISFSEVPSRTDLGWVDGNNVVVNSGHPAYVKACSNPTTKRLCSLFAIAISVQRFLIAEENGAPMFMDRMMAAWGKK